MSRNSSKLIAVNKMLDELKAIQSDDTNKKWNIVFNQTDCSDDKSNYIILKI